MLTGSLLLGFGAFNLIEGMMNHHLLGVHHVNETVSRSQRIWWDLGFLVCGAVMLGLGFMVLRRASDVAAAGGHATPVP